MSTFMTKSDRPTTQAVPFKIKPPFSEDLKNYILHLGLARTGNEEKRTVVQFMEGLSEPKEEEKPSMCNFFKKKPKPEKDLFPEDKHVIRKFIYTLCIDESFLTSNYYSEMKKYNRELIFADFLARLTGAPFTSDEIIPVKFPWKSIPNPLELGSKCYYGSFCLATSADWQFHGILNEFFGWKYQRDKVQHFKKEQLSGSAQMFYYRPHGAKPIFIRTMETVTDFKMVEVILKRDSSVRSVKGSETEAVSATT